MLWYLVVCTAVHGGIVCLPAQPMASREACLQVGRAYPKRRFVYVTRKCVVVSTGGN